MIKNQKKLINKKDWDVLIILDACRHDYFEEVYDDYLNGELKKVESEGTHTAGWLKNSFEGDWNDTVYVAGNAYVNSSNVPTRGFFPKKTFPNIVDAWEGKNDERWKVLSPKIVGRYARIARAKYPKKKIIVHFVQPHTPYRKETDEDLRDLQRVGNLNKRKPIKTRFKESVYDILIATLGYKRARSLRNLLWEFGVLSGQKGHIEEMAGKYGNEKIIEFYKDNLRWVLEEVKKTVKRIPDEEIVVTADHGELLGEEGDYGHNRYYRHPILVGIPWLEVKEVSDNG